MKDRESVLRDMLIRHTEHIHFREQRKKEIKTLMMDTLSSRNKSLAERLADRVMDFWHSTYEISVVPIVAAICLVLLTATSSIYYYPGMTAGQQNKKCMYIQTAIQSPDCYSIVFIPIDGEVSKDEDN